MMLTKTGGRWLTLNPKHCYYQLSKVLTLVNVTNTTRLYGDRIDREKTRINIHTLICRHNFLILVYVYVVICRHCGIFSISLAS